MKEGRGVAKTLLAKNEENSIGKTLEALFEQYTYTHIAGSS
jgi:hypothetical protein